MEWWEKQECSRDSHCCTGRERTVCGEHGRAHWTGRVCVREELSDVLSDVIHSPNIITQCTFCALRGK